MDQRRKEDERIDKLIGITERNSILLDQVHKSWFGVNGNDGYKTKIDKMEGGMNSYKWLIGSGGGIGIIALIITLYKLFIG